MSEGTDTTVLARVESQVFDSLKFLVNLKHHTINYYNYGIMQYKNVMYPIYKDIEKKRME